MRFFEAGTGPRVKICGLTLPENALAVVEAGADAIGVNFWPGSKRYVAGEEAAGWLGELAGKVCRVGLFVNAPLETIESVVDLCVLDAIQLHGDEPPEFVDEAGSFGLPVIKALAMRDDGCVVGSADHPTPWLLLDAHVPGLWGGTGETVSWEAAREFVTANPDRRIILAGGLTPENVAEAVSAVAPHAVDVASGVESSRGVKDLDAVRAFVAACRSE